MRAYILFEACGGLPVEDVSPITGGRHVYVRVGEGERFTVELIRPIMRALQALFPTLDTQPMTNPRVGCITVPGSRLKDGGFRELVRADLRDLIERLTLPARQGFLERLTAKLQPQLVLDDLADDESIIDAAASRSAIVEAIAESGRDLTVSLPAATAARLPVSLERFIRSGDVPPRRMRDGQLWSASEARLSLMQHLARRGWSGERVWESMQQWPPVWAPYAARPVKARKTLFRTEWEKAFTAARDRAPRTVPVTSADPGHKVDQTAHRGAPPSLPKRRLAAARVWLLTSGHLQGRSLAPALLVVTALAHAISLSGNSTAAFGTRGLAGLCGLSAESVRRSLSLLRDLPGSPVRLVRATSLATQVSEAGRVIPGDEYTLVMPTLGGRPVRAEWWEEAAARLDAVDPVWSTFKCPFSWWIWHTMLAIDRGDRSTPLPLRTIAAGARVSIDTVEAAVAELAEHGLVDRSYGHAVRTGRTVRQLGEHTTIGDELHEERLARFANERRVFKEFLRIISAEFGQCYVSARKAGANRVISGVQIDDVDDWLAYVADVGRRGPPIGN